MSYLPYRHSNSFYLQKRGRTFIISVIIYGDKEAKKTAKYYNKSRSLTIQQLLMFT